MLETLEVSINKLTQEFAANLAIWGSPPLVVHASRQNLDAFFLIERQRRPLFELQRLELQVPSRQRHCFGQLK